VPEKDVYTDRKRQEAHNCEERDRHDDAMPDFHLDFLDLKRGTRPWLHSCFRRIRGMAECDRFVSNRLCPEAGIHRFHDVRSQCRMLG